MENIVSNLNCLISELNAEFQKKDSPFPINQLEGAIHAFSLMRDSILSKSFDKSLQNYLDKIMRWSIESRIRYPGGLHEWLMCSRANIFKKWGVSMDDIKKLRTKVDDVIFKNPPGIHGGPGSTRAHNEILDLIDSSNSYAEFKEKLISWSEKRLEGGSKKLPSGFFE